MKCNSRNLKHAVIHSPLGDGGRSSRPEKPILSLHVQQSFLRRTKWGYNEITEGGRTGNAPSIETHKYHYCQNTLDLSRRAGCSPHATWHAFVCPGCITIPTNMQQQRLVNFTLIADRLGLNHTMSNGFPLLPTRVGFALFIR